MKVLKAFLAVTIGVIFVFFVLPSASAYDIQLTPEYYKVKDFKLTSGAVLDEMTVEYATLGAPVKDAQGVITNAVVFCHGWSGDYSQIKLFKGAVGPGLPVDPEKYFYICPTALGSPGSSSPSVSGLGPKFPKYTVADMIAAQYLLVTEHLKIPHLKGVMGASMGGFQTLQWITDYPDMMDWAIPIAMGPKFSGRNIGVFGLMSEAVKSDPAYMDGNYTEQPKAGMRRAFMGTYLFYFTHAFFQSKFKTPEAVMKGLENAGLGSEKMDANDIIWRNDSMAVFDVTAKLPSVKAKTLVIGVNDDELFPPEEEFRPVAYAIAGAKLFSYDSIFGHLGCALHIDRANDAMLQFLAAVDGK